MAEDEKDGQLDALLDSFLSDYSAVEPRPGLEIRIHAGLKAHARQRRRQWALVFAASAAMVILAVLIARTHTEREVVPNHVAVQKSSPDTAPAPVHTVASAPRKTPHPVAPERHAKLRNSPDSRILLQALNALPQADNTVFVHEKLYLSPATQPEPEPAREERASAPNISIQHLEVRPIEIKDLSSAKDMN
jgi:hypothetical protein